MLYGINIVKRNMIVQPTLPPITAITMEFDNLN